MSPLPKPLPCPVCGKQPKPPSPVHWSRSREVAVFLTPAIEGGCYGLDER